MTLTYTDTVLN